MTVLPPMNDPDKVDALVSAHLQKTLDAQRGRAVNAFRQHVHSNAQNPDPLSFEAQARRRSIRMLRVWAGAASALAACLALVVTLQFLHTTDNPLPAPTEHQDLPLTPAGVPVMDQVELSREVDGGTQVLDDQTPVRIVRQQQLKQMQWFDPTEKATYSVTEPIEKVGYVRLQPN
ncbi:MAG: hypothetical protein ACTHN5_14930 [Phycisphaerae bacterium]